MLASPDCPSDASSEPARRVRGRRALRGAAERGGGAGAAQRERVDLPFVTIDPPGSRDLDQALHIERSGGGHVVHYAIADVAAFVDPAARWTARARAGRHGLLARRQGAALPAGPLRRGGEPAAGEWRPAVLWAFELDERGELVSTDVRRAEVRAARSTRTRTCRRSSSRCCARSASAGSGLEQARGGVRLDVPEQEVVATAARGRSLPRAAAERGPQRAGLAADRDGGRGADAARRHRDPPHAARPGQRALERLRLTGEARSRSAGRPSSLPDFVAGLDPAVPAHAALMQEATGVGRGAGYTAFDGAPPAKHGHSRSPPVRARDGAAAPAPGPLRERVLPRRGGGHSPRVRAGLRRCPTR